MCAFMASPRLAVPARKGSSLLLGVALPCALLAALLAVGVALIVSGSGHSAADKELDLRAATVKQTWEIAGRPAQAVHLRALGARLDARLRIVPGLHTQPGATSGGVREYGFATRGARTLLVTLPVSASADALSSGLVAGLIIALAGALLLVALFAVLLRRR